jgi:electron transfer flavoprotein beta subunit
MRIVVLVKQVPGDIHISLKQDYTINREAMQKIMNPADVSALALAAGVKKRYGGEISCMTMGPKSAADCLREAAISGADELYHLCDSAFAGSDTFITAKILSAAIRVTGGADLILCGRHTIDGETGQVGPEISVMLGISCVTYITEITEINSSTLRCIRLTGSEAQYFSVKLPAVLSVCDFFVTPSLPSVATMRKASALPIKLLTARDINLAHITGRESSPTKVERVYIKERERRKVSILSTEEGIQKIVEIVRKGNSR